MYDRNMTQKAWETWAGLSLTVVAALAFVGIAEYATTGEADTEIADPGAGAEPDTGESELVWGEGHHYRGGVRAGTMHGRGTHTAPDGEVYSGDFVNGERHGQGTLRFPNGDVYAGDFSNGEMTGRGRLSWANGDAYEGEFVDGAREGRGVLERQAGGTYVGSFSADQRHGLGHYRWRDGTLYKGHFYFGKQHGSGLKMSPTGERTFETWNDGQLVAAVDVEAVEHCTLAIDDHPWMFNDDTCINGLAHGAGLAVSLDGTAYISNGRFILGKKVRGEIRSLELGEDPAR